MGTLYRQRAHIALGVYDIDRQLVNLELALPHLREAARIFRAIDHAGKADQLVLSFDAVQEDLRTYRAVRAAAVAAATTGRK